MEIIKLGMFTLSPEGILNHEVSEQLTERENEILRYLSEHLNQVVGKQELVLVVWGNDDFFNIRSGDVFVTRLSKRLRDDPDIQLEIIKDKGWRLSVKEGKTSYVPASNHTAVSPSQPADITPHMVRHYPYTIILLVIPIVLFCYMYFFSPPAPYRIIGFVEKGSIHISPDAKDTSYILYVKTIHERKIKCYVARSIFYSYNINQFIRLQCPADRFKGNIRTKDL